LANINRITAYRESLISFALEFVNVARYIPGVTRIALFGSLATDKEDPKDVDLLVAVTDDADLSPLAKAARRLQGRAQSLNRGGEVFLTDTHGKYLGRICPWKNCGPGYRVSCDAHNCGRRPYLHDDLGVFQLNETLIETPPIDIWPRYIERVKVPGDLKRAIIKEINITGNQTLPN
jgi:predicted nucleotidyltransferase